MLTTEECDALKADMYEIERVWRETGELPEGMDPNHYSWFTAVEEDFFRIDNLPHLTKSFYDYVTHPRLLAMMEGEYTALPAPWLKTVSPDTRASWRLAEITGVEVRLEQCDAHIRRPTRDGPPPPKDGGPPRRYGLHGGQKGYLGRAFSHIDKGLYHYTFVKTLTNLSDLGPDDGTQHARHDDEDHQHDRHHHHHLF